MKAPWEEKTGYDIQWLPEIEKEIISQVLFIIHLKNYLYSFIHFARIFWKISLVL